MIKIEITDESMRQLWALRRAHQMAARQMETKGDTAVTRLVAFVTTRLGQRWEETAPYLTGTLASATREQIFGEQGKVFIDPTVENPVFGGLPVIYGPAVHKRRPWVDAVFVSDAPGIIVEGGKTFFDEIGREYRGV